MEEEKAINEGYFKVEFASIKAGTEYFKLDGTQRVTEPIYYKFIKSYDDLDEFEKVYIFHDYFRLKRKIASVINVLLTSQ